MSRCAVTVGFLVGSAITTTTAAADPATATNSALQLAFAVNSPIGWPDGNSIAGSIYFGFAKHHAIRANAGHFSYGFTQSSGTAIGDLFFGGDGDDDSHKGRTVDVSVGYMVFPRRLWSGPLLEAALLIRDRDAIDEVFDSGDNIAVKTKTVAGRALAGWSWLAYDHVFVSIAAGVARGYETGTQTITASSSAGDPMPEIHAIARWTTSGEAFLRFGGAFSL